MRDGINWFCAILAVVFLVFMLICHLKGDHNSMTFYGILAIVNTINIRYTK